MTSTEYAPDGAGHRSPYRFRPVTGRTSGFSCPLVHAESSFMNCRHRYRGVCGGQVTVILAVIPNMLELKAIQRLLSVDIRPRSRHQGGRRYHHECDRRGDVAVTRTQVRSRRADEVQGDASRRNAETPLKEADGQADGPCRFDACP